MHKIRLSTFQIIKLMNHSFCVLIKRHLDFEEGRAKGRPLVDDFEEAQFGIFSRFSCVLVEQRHDGLGESQVYSEPLNVKPRVNPLT